MKKSKLMLGTQLDAVIFSAGVQHVVKFMEPENIDLERECTFLTRTTVN